MSNCEYVQRFGRQWSFVEITVVVSERRKAGSEVRLIVNYSRKGGELLLWNSGENVADVPVYRTCIGTSSTMVDRIPEVHAAIAY